MRVLAALSGGVDSAVAAARAVEAGHEVVGVHMALSRSRAQHRNGSRGCCSIEDAGDARRAADVLGIPYYVWDLSEEFEETVVADFLTEYAAGRTPNPCVRCNEHIKFSALLDRGIALGFDAVATGHYARIAEVPDGAGGTRRELHRAVDPLKDQSYVLAVMGAERLERALFPLGDAPSKDAVRAEAAARGLSVSAKPDSYDICFVADGDTHGFLRERLGARPGEVVDADGRVLGEHDGAYAYTVGQRKGLGLTRPAPDGRPRYVLEVRPQTQPGRGRPRGAALRRRDQRRRRRCGWPTTSRRGSGARSRCRCARTGTRCPRGSGGCRTRAGLVPTGRPAGCSRPGWRPRCGASLPGSRWWSTRARACSGSRRSPALGAGRRCRRDHRVRHEPGDLGADPRRPQAASSVAGSRIHHSVNSRHRPCWSSRMTQRLR